jgi:hypothetical protein
MTDMQQSLTIIITHVTGGVLSEKATRKPRHPKGTTRICEGFAANQSRMWLLRNMNRTYGKSSKRLLKYPPHKLISRYQPKPLQWDSQAYLA